MTNVGVLIAKIVCERKVFDCYQLGPITLYEIQDLLFFLLNILQRRRAKYDFLTLGHSLSKFQAD